MPQTTRDEPLPALIEQCLEPAPKPEAPQPREEKICADDVVVLLELPSLEDLAVSGFDRGELQEIADSDPMEQDSLETPVKNAANGA